MKKLLFLVLFLVLVGCGTETEPDVTIGNAYFFAARCDIYDGSSNLTVCIEYDDFFSTTLASDCSLHESIFGGANNNFTDATGSPGCSSSSRVGLCEASDGKFHFYSSQYTAAAAQTECNSLGGTFQ